MANKYRNLIYSTSEYTHKYEGFKGVERSGSDTMTSEDRMSYCINMYKDYAGDGADVIETAPGYRCIADAEDKVNAMHRHMCRDGSERVYVHAGDKLKYFTVGDLQNSDTVSLTDAASELEDSKSRSVTYGEHLYILDGRSILQIDGSGTARRLTDNESVYIPTTYISGEKHEARNLVTDRFREEFYISDPLKYFAATDGLKYTITDAELCLCSVSGYDESVTGRVYIPAYIEISGVTYKVIRIEKDAFANNASITEVYIANGVGEIGFFAFDKCTSLRKIAIPDSVRLIDGGAFSDCGALNEIYIGKGLRELGLNVFTTCISLREINYALSENDFSQITNASTIESINKVYNSRYTEVRLYFPFHDDTIAVSMVEVNGMSHSSVIAGGGGKIKGVYISFENIDDATGAVVKISGILYSKKASFSASSDDDDAGKLSGEEAINGCRICAVFDGRLFLSGNPRLPGTVFYTCAGGASNDGKLYFEEYNYFNDGSSTSEVVALLTVRDMLAVFKDRNDPGGSIYYHTSRLTGEDLLTAVYPVAYVHSGIHAAGDAISFYDDPVFLTQNGLYAMTDENINYQRSVVPRSGNINFDLLKEDLSCAELAEWCGYLAVCTSGRIYLADSRASFISSGGHREYEWFVFDSVGSYRNDRILFKYDDTGVGELEVKTGYEHTDAGSDIYSDTDNEGAVEYYTQENGIKYRVYMTDEKVGGVFSPAVSLLSIGTRLFFATEDGQISVFNNDKRGIAPARVEAEAGYDSEEYSQYMRNRIHPEYYSFAGHRIISTMRTALDNCGIPHLTKNTVKKSLVIKASSTSGGSIRVGVKTDLGDERTVAYIPNEDVSFSSLRFDGNLWNEHKYMSIAVKENEKNWIEKQIILTSDKFKSPIGIYSIVYRYTIKGKIKNSG